MASMGRASAGLAALVIAAAALSACGGGSDSSSTSTSSSGAGSSSVAKTPYGKSLGNLCAHADKTVNALPEFPYPTFNPYFPDTSKLPSIGRFFDRTSLPAYEAFVSKVDKVQPPPSQKQAFEAFRRDLDAYLANLKRQISAAKASDSSTFVDTVKAFGDIESRAHADEGALGIPPCEGIT